MPKFAYVASTLDGEQVKGTERASSRDDAELALYERELRDLEVTEKKSLLQFESPDAGQARRGHALLPPARRFLRAGIPILDAVHVVGEESDELAVRRMMADIEDGLRAGVRFSDASTATRSLPRFYRGILRSAELTGELDTCSTSSRGTSSVTSRHAARSRRR